MKTILIAVAWPYANAPIHEGHPPGYLIPADIFARYNRLIGNEVLMVSGTDAHGTPNTIAAEKAGIPTGEYVDSVHNINLEFWKKLGISYDLYTKTSNEAHKEKFKELFMEIYNNEFVIKKKVKYFYSEKERKALLDRYIEGECPHCHFEKARGDQCDNCGKTLTPFELINPYSIYGDTKLEVKETEDLFFDLPKLQNELEKWTSDKTYWKSHVINFTKAWLDEGLLPRAVTRDIDWGIEIPDKIDLPDKDNKRFYVWVEAVAGYLTASKIWSEI
ncbi:class I tRNA ligase family protein, partial [Candidatus Dojkabacteria bacterium]|nr:class I tRNA ligase family protein [Candidatus Dojkabacteria bacterium]